MEKFPPEESAGETEESVWKGICKRIDTVLWTEIR